MKSRTVRRTVNRYLTALFLIFLMQLIIAASVFAVENHPGYPLLPLEEMRIAVYTKAFAERFGLPAPAPGTEPDGGLEAIEFAIEKGPSWYPHYFCNLYLYVDSSLPIKYPEEGVAGGKYKLISATHFFGRTHEQWMEWPIEDRHHFNERQGSYNRKARLATMDYIPNKKGATSDLDYMEFHKDLLPSLAYMKLNFTPFNLMIDESGRGIVIWLQQLSNTDYRSHTSTQKTDFIKFSIPEPVSQKISEWGLQARAANTKLNTIKMEKQE